MLRRAHEEDGMGIIELMAAMAVLTVALLALMASFDTVAVSLHSSQRNTTASTLANTQMELYRALPYASIGLDTDALSTAQGDSVYSADETALNATLDHTTDAVDSTIDGCSTSSGSAPQCLPIQTLTGSDGHRYQLETFIRDVQNNTAIRWTERVVTVIVRDAGAPGTPELLRLTSAFDRT
jgi:Tfp pilus assembly protein PilV